MSEPEGATDAHPRRPFAAALQEVRDGVLHAELGDELARVVEAVKQTGKTGKLTLELSIKSAEIAGGLVVTDKVTAKVPEDDKSASLFFADAQGNLSRRDPRQPELPLKAVGPTPAQEASA